MANTRRTVVILIGLVLLSQLAATENLTDGYYVELTPEEPVEPTGISYGPILQMPILPNEPVRWKQNISVNGSNVTINLFESSVPVDLIASALEITIRERGTIIAETPVFYLDGAHELEVTYATSPVRTTVECAEERLRDVIPADAQNVETDVDLSAVLSERCLVTVQYEPPPVYSNIIIPLSTLGLPQPTTIYHEESERYLDEPIIRIP